MTAEKIILKYQEKGVKLFLNEDKLQFSGPKGIIDDDARKELQAYKDDIITYLKSHKGQVVCDKTQRFLPFEMTDIQVAYVIGRNRTYQYGGIGCKIYAEYEFPKLDLEKLERAWENVVKNNDMLHAVIKNNKEQQILQDYEVPAIEKWKIEDISPDERKNKLNEIRDRLVMKQYKVGEWPLFDLEISELEDVTILHISLDMLIADFLSINIIVDELEDNYFGDKKKTFTKELSFRDVIVYEHNRQKHPQYSETMKKDKQYWEERISTMPEAPDLPVKEDLKDTSIRQLNTYIEKERYLELQKLADDNNITLSGLILACYAEVLAYWSNSKRFSINVTMANREQVHPDIYSIIGDFTKINILEICQDYNLSFIQRVQFIQKQLWNDMEHIASVVCEHNIDYIDTFGIGIDKEELYNYESTMIIGAGSFPGLSGILPVWIRKEQQESEIRRVNIFAGGNEHITASACADFLLSTFSQFGKIDSYYSHQQIKKTENITERVPLIFPDTAEIMEYLPDEIYLSAEYSRIDELHWYNVQTNSEYRNIIQEALLKLMISQEYEYVNRLAENVKRKLENKREESKTWYRIWLEIETVTEKKNYGYEALDSYKINGRIAAFCAEALCSGICQKGIYWPFEILDAEIVMNSLINEEILIGLKENDKKMQEHDLNYEEGEL